MHRHRSPRRAAKGRAQGSYSAQQALTSRYRRGSLRSAAKRGVHYFHPETRAALIAAFGGRLEGQQKVHHLRGAQGAHGWSGRPFGARFLPTRVCPARAERRGAWTWHTSEMLDLWIKLGEYNQLALVLVLKKTRQAGGRRVAKHRQKSLSVRNNGNGLGFAGK